MSPEHIEMFEAAAGGLLEELGYARAFPQVRSDGRQQAARVRESFLLNTRRRAEEEPLREAVHE